MIVIKDDKIKFIPHQKYDGPRLMWDYPFFNHRSNVSSKTSYSTLHSRYTEDDDYNHFIPAMLERIKTSSSYEIFFLYNTKYNKSMWVHFNNFQSIGVK